MWIAPRFAKALKIVALEAFGNCLKGRVDTRRIRQQARNLVRIGLLIDVTRRIEHGISNARAVFGYRRANSRVLASTFSGWSGQIACEVVMVNPIPMATASAFQGSPAL